MSQENREDVQAAVEQTPAPADTEVKTAAPEAAAAPARQRHRPRRAKGPISAAVRGAGVPTRGVLPNSKRRPAVFAMTRT